MGKLGCCSLPVNNSTLHYFQSNFSCLCFLEVICLVDEIEVSESKEALIVLAGTVAGAATTFVASLPIPLGIKARCLR
jgi:hypothetical protein